MQNLPHTPNAACSNQISETRHPNEQPFLHGPIEKLNLAGPQLRNAQPSGP